MAITASGFASRYKIACFFIANHLFETVISVDPELDLTDLAKLQRDQGFFMSSLRLVEQLTAFKSDSEMERLQEKITNSGTMYFKKSILTAVVKQGATPDPNADVPEKPKQENLYDKLVVKRLYDSYFSAYVEDTEPLEFLDKPDPRQAEDLVSIFELGVFDSPTLATISEILDFEKNDGLLAAIAVLAANPRYKTYEQFFKLVSQCL